MAHSNRKSRREMKTAEKRKRRAANNALYASYRDADKNQKQARQGKAIKQPGHRHKNGPCGNIGCMRDSQIARQGYINLMTRTHGPFFAAKMAMNRGWEVK